MVDDGNYFTVNRPRQFGKTTLLSALARKISHEYICIRLSFEGIGDACFNDEESFCVALTDLIQTALLNSPAGYDPSYAEEWKDETVVDFIRLKKHITKMCKDRKVALIIDEVDKTGDNRIFLHFLGLLRDKYLLRKDGLDHTFHSVILAGVYDIRNLKLKLASDNDAPASYGHMLNSPWNIATAFTADMSFSPEQIGGMLSEYEQDCATGMDIKRVADCIHEYTGGYPYLVSHICYILDNDMHIRNGWSPEGVRNAVKFLINQNPLNTLFDDICKYLETYPDVYAFIYNILILGKQENYTVSNPIVQIADMLGFIKNKDGDAVISNRIYEIFIADYFTSKDSVSRKNNRITGYKSDIVKAGGRFDMERCMIKFAELFREVYGDTNKPFIEEHGRMIFLTYLKPMINGDGFYHIESRLTDQRRMDLVVDYGADQFIIELKLWYGESAHEKAYDQLVGYLKEKGLSVGYLLTYDFRKEKNREQRSEWVEWCGTRIFDVVL